MIFFRKKKTKSLEELRKEVKKLEAEELKRKERINLQRKISELKPKNKIIHTGVKVGSAVVGGITRGLMELGDNIRIRSYEPKSYRPRKIKIKRKKIYKKKKPPRAAAKKRNRPEPRVYLGV